MAPKAAAKAQPGTAKPSVLDLTFPPWSDAPPDKEVPHAEKYQDVAGVMLPPQSQEHLDTWKRPEELVLNMPNVPMLRLKQPALDPKDAKGAKAVPVATREHEGRLFAGHKSFDWLKSVFNTVVSVQKSLAPNTYLWELIYPKEKDGLPCKSPNGKYRVKLFIMGEWRTVAIDDRIPVDLFGQFLVVGVRPMQLWPMLLSKAILKVMAAQRILDLALPHQVAAFRLLTGWPQEDLLDPLGGTQLLGGFLFDRLQDTVQANEQREERRNVGTVCLIERTLPERPPPRIIVLVGPSAVGCGRLMRRLVEEFPERFGLTISHTTRLPHEHEVHGQDYYFVDKAAFRAEAAEGKFLEQAAVAGIHDTFLYGTSIATVREVAATGRLCLMGLDAQGVASLRANHRIDGLYIFISPPSLEELQERARGRLREAESTIAKRLDWASQQMAEAAKPGAFDHVVPNDDLPGAYHQLKEAISTLSPIIRNRLRGLPAYVLDYSDLIPPNLVEKPFLKPVIIAGPTTGERVALMADLVREFPDVFALPRLTTTRHPRDLDRYRITPAEARAMAEASSKPKRGRTAAPSTAGGLVSGAPPSMGGLDLPDEDEEAMGPSDGPSPPSLTNEVTVVSQDQFDEAVRSGQLLEYHSDLFRHPIVTHRTGVTYEAIREVIMAGKLPLLEMEVEGLVMFKGRKEGIDCLSIFLQPPSLEEYGARVRQWLTESEEDLEARAALAAQQVAVAEGRGAAGGAIGIGAAGVVAGRGASGSGDGAGAAAGPAGLPGLPGVVLPPAAIAGGGAKGGPHDHTIVNDTFDRAYAELRDLISRYRPEILTPTEGSDAAAAEAAAAAVKPPGEPHPLLVLAGPPGDAGRIAAEQLASTLCSMFPAKFAVPPLVTDRKPAKGEVSTPQLQFLAAKDFAKLQTDGALAVQYGAAEGSIVGVTKDAVQDVVGRGAVAVVVLPDPGLVPDIRAGPDPAAGALFVFAARQASLSAAGADAAALEAAAAAAEEAGHADPVVFHAVVTDDEDMDAAYAVWLLLSTHVPAVVAPPYRPLVVAGPFGTGKRAMLQRLFDSLQGRFAVPVITTTRAAGPRDLDDRSDMAVVGQEEAEALLAAGQFLVHERTLDQLYGVTRGAVKKVQASGRVCVVELDHVADAQRLREEGFDAVYVFIGLESTDELFRRIHAEITHNPPLGYEPDEAVNLFFQGAKAEVQASRQEGLFDAWVDNGNDAAAAFTQLAEAVHLRYPDVVVREFVWGYGRSLWDPSVRKYGEHPLRVMVLGPAAAGKSSLCEMLAKHFQLPHINVGDLLYEEVKAKTKLGLEAKVYMDASKTVPDEFFYQMLEVRLKQPDCLANGWMLDGFPHTEPQTARLADMNIVPDKVIFMTADHDVLLDRTRHRKIDYMTNKVYHVPAKGVESLSPPIEPQGRDAAEISSRLQARHDDSEDNVRARLALWDEHLAALRRAYADVSLRVQADAALEEPFGAAVSFFTLEAKLPDVEVVLSKKLGELQYEIVDTMRYKRQQLVKLQEADPPTRTHWVDSQELAANAHCLLLGQDPTQFEEHQGQQHRRRANLNKAPRSLLFTLDSPEPTEVLISLDVGVQWSLEDYPVTPRRVLVVSGPVGVGKTTLVAQLLRDFPSKLHQVCAVTSASPNKGEHDGAPYLFVPAAQLAEEVASGECVAQCEHAGALYAVPIAEVEAAWEAGKLAVMEAPLALALAMKVGMPKDFEVHCTYLSLDTDPLDVRLRGAGVLEEQALMEELQRADKERAEAVDLAAQGPGGKAGLVDLLVAAEGTPQQVYMPVRELVGQLWHRPRAPMPCQLTVEDFDWKLQAHGATRKRLRTFLGAGTTLELPRGRHLMRVTANSELLHALTFWCIRPFHANEYTEVMKVAEPTCYTSCLEGEYGPLPAGTCNLLVRYNLKLSEPTLLAASLAISGEDLRACTRLVLVNNDTGEEQVVPLARLPATLLEPAAKGYCILALTSVPAAPALLPARPGVVHVEHAAAPTPGSKPVTPTTPASAAAGSPAAGQRPAAAPGPAVSTAPVSGVAEDGSWALSVTASVPPAALEPVSVQRVQVLEGSYQANARLVLSRQLLVPTVASQLALVLTTKPPVPFRLRLQQVPAGKEVVWGQDYTPVLQRDAPSGSLHLYNLALPAGKYIMHTELLAEQCPEGLQPSPVDGSVQGAPISWRAVYMPSADAAVCPVVADDSQQRYFRSMFEGWAVAAAQAAAQTATDPKAGKAAAAVGPRSQVASSALAKYLAEREAIQAAEAAAASSEAPPTPPLAAQRTLKTGTNMALDPDAHLVVRTPEPGQPTKVLVAEEVAARLAAQQEMAEAASKKGQGELAAALDKGKSSRGALAARRASEFSEWRSQRANGSKDALKARAAAAVEAKRAAEAAAAEAAAAAAAEATPTPAPSARH